MHPHPQLESFGAMVVLAPVASFLPSLLARWARWIGAGRATDRSSTPAVAED